MLYVSLAAEILVIPTARRFASAVVRPKNGQATSKKDVVGMALLVGVIVLRRRHGAEKN